MFWESKRFRRAAVFVLSKLDPIRFGGALAFRESTAPRNVISARARLARTSRRDGRRRDGDEPRRRDRGRREGARRGSREAGRRGRQRRRQSATSPRSPPRVARVRRSAKPAGRARRRARRRARPRQRQELRRARRWVPEGAHLGWMGAFGEHQGRRQGLFRGQVRGMRRGVRGVFPPSQGREPAGVPRVSPEFARRAGPVHRQRRRRPRPR